MKVKRSVEAGEAEIDALLAHDENSSVIDAFLAIPALTAPDSRQREWQELLHARLQTRLSRRMRETLESGKQDLREGKC